MGKRNSQRKNTAMLDNDDDSSSSVSSSSTSRTDHVSVSVSGNEEVHFDQDALLDQALDALDEKRDSTRERALSVIIGAFSSKMQHQFVDKKFATLLHQCLALIKKGSKKASAKEIALTSHAIGLLSLTVGCSDNAREIFEESVRPLDEFLTSKSDLTKIPSLLECLAIITFVGGNGLEETERSMDILWRVIHPRLGSNVVAVKPSAPLITAVVSAWSFLVSTMSDLKLNSKNWQNSISYLSSLLDKEDRPVRIAAGEALVVIFEIGITEKFSADSKGASDMTQEEINRQESYTHLQGLKAKVINQVKNLSVEAGGKGSAKKDLNNQRNLFRDIVDFFEYGYSPEISMKIGGDSLQTSSWSQMIQLNFLKHFLGGGFVKHMQVGFLLAFFIISVVNLTFFICPSSSLVNQENEFLQEVFNFTPKRRYLNNNEHRMSSGEKRMFKSPNSVQNKARTQLLNKQRLLSEVGFLAI
ncbi:Interferon-related developmental regulator 1 isoform A [Glycine soja]|uniref:Interferon-related developmental regulator 1 isoform A n=1 Tax=Glycine soja TaxID=3848 RepID=A0A445H3I3_GLYSO|nr:Interferon-related developmental regulator 1 isoform A [Glycine soja]